jgi:CubicO group peptidase (beta-lactamase class C family)
LAAAFSILDKAIADRAFPGASIAVTVAGELRALKALGRFIFETEYEEKPLEAGTLFPASVAKSENSAVANATLFDLASLTKVVATTTMAMLLYERGLLDLDTPIAAIVPEFISNAKKDPRRHDVTGRLLLAHSSGLPAYERLFLKTKTRDELINAAFTMPLAADPATRAEYSDIGFIVLGIALERLADETLDRFCQREIFGPLDMTNTTFNPHAELRNQIPPTADERPWGADTPVGEMPVSKQQSSASPKASQESSRSTFRQRIIQGEVQDENASVLGGVAPHAGLFSAARDLAKFAHAILNSGSSIVRAETVALFTRRQPTPAGTTRALGWDTPSAVSQSGRYLSANSFGHFGYTGTSLWIDPARELSITLLTNRTWPDCSNHAIKQVRPVFHDAVVEALEKSS